MDTLKALATRKSVREFTDEGITFEDIKTILTAGMSGPTCENKRMWSFVVVRNKEKLGKLAVANGLDASPVRRAALGILVTVIGITVIEKLCQRKNRIKKNLL